MTIEEFKQRIEKKHRVFEARMFERADPAHQAAIIRMREHPCTLEQMLEQVRRNGEIRRQNIIERMKEAENRKAGKK